MTLVYTQIADFGLSRDLQNKDYYVSHGGRFQSNGQLQRPFTITTTPLPMMSGAMAASSMRYGHWDVSLFVHLLILR